MLRKISFINCIGLFYGVDSYETRLMGFDILLKGLQPILRENDVILLSLMLFIGLFICCYAFLGVYNLLQTMFLAGTSPIHPLSFILVTFLLNLPVFPIHSYYFAAFIDSFIFLQLSFIFYCFYQFYSIIKSIAGLVLYLASTQQNQNLLNLIQHFLQMPFLKTDLHTGASNHSSIDGKGQNRVNSTQKIYNSGSKVNASQKLLIQKFRQQTQELKEIKKTISTISHSRLVNMQRLKVQKLPEQQSMNLYTLSQPSTKENTFKINKSKKIVTNLNLNKNQSSPSKKQELDLDSYPYEQAKVEQNVEEYSAKVKAKQINLIKSEIKNEKKETQDNILIQFEEIPSPLIENQPQNSLPLNSSKKRSFSAHSIKNIQNLALIYKKQKHYDTQSNQVSLVSSGFNSPMELKHRYQERLKQSRAKIMSSKVKIVQSQTNFKLQKKIKQNLQLIEKQKTLHELIHTRMERERQKAEQIRRKNEQKRLVHESRRMKVGIQRAYRKEFEQKQKQFHRSRSEETLLNVMYNRYAKEMDEIKKQQLLAYKLQFLKNLESVQFKPVTRGNNPEQELSVLYEE